MASNGHSQKQAFEKFQFRDISHSNFYDNNNQNTSASILEPLDEVKERKKLSHNILFWQGSYLSQQLIFIKNWAFTTKRSAFNTTPSPLSAYRMPLYTTRVLIFSSWLNGRELLGQVRLLKEYLGHIRVSSKETIRSKDVIKEITDELIHVHSSDEKKLKDAAEIFEDILKKKEESEDDNKTLDYSLEDCFYIIAAKGVHNFHISLHYTRILTDNNQAIVFPPPAFMLLHLWQLLYRMVDYEKNAGKNYNQARNTVQKQLRKYASTDMRTSHMDLDYVTAETIRQLTIHSTLGDIRSTSRVNVLQNKYYLNDDYEDPCFHLDWTLTQMLIPSALMSIRRIEQQMEELRKDLKEDKKPPN